MNGAYDSMVAYPFCGLFPSPGGITVILPFLIGAFFWVRGLLRDRPSDCGAGVAIAVVWSLVLVLAMGTCIPLNNLGFVSIGSGVLTMVISALDQKRTKIPSRSMRLIGLLLIVGGVALAALL